MSMTESLQPLCNYYNNFFHPNVCHVCKSRDQQNLKLCACYMISYCCKQHRREHRPEHRDICRIIIDVSKKRNIWSTRFMTMEGWNQFKMANMQYMKQKLNRNLKPYEEQMFLFAKSCIICHKQDNLYVSCEVCMSVNVCVDHYLDRYNHNCLLLRHYLEIETQKIWREKDNTAIQKRFLCMDKANVHNLWPLIRKSLYNQNLEFCYDHYIYTDIFSTSLTLFYGIQDANLSHLFEYGFFVVHIITDVIDTRYLLAWENILHELRPRAKLEVVVTGPQLKEHYHNVHICSVCIDAKKTLRYECHRMLYHDFVHILHMRPNVILALDMEFRNKDTSAKVIKAIQCQCCPLIITSKSRYTAQENIIEIQNALQLPLIPIITKNNIFASCKPYRDYENYSVFFPNEYLVVYSELK